MISRKRIDEVCSVCGITTEIVFQFIQEEWLIPLDREREYFDEEDVARIRLILELRNDFGVNDEAIPIILHLVDQLNIYRLNLS